LDPADNLVKVPPLDETASLVFYEPADEAAVALPQGLKFLSVVYVRGVGAAADLLASLPSGSPVAVPMDGTRVAAGALSGEGVTFAMDGATGAGPFWYSLKLEY
jgi:hypothetical protein